MLEKALSILTLLSEMTSNKDKEELLAKNQNNEVLKTLLLNALDPYTQFYIRKMPEYTPVKNPVKPALAFQLFIELLDKLNTRTITGNEAKTAITQLFCCLPTEIALWFEKIMLKEAIGVGAKTVNKAFKSKLIPEFNLLLAPNELPNLTKIAYPIGVTPKYDGFRAVYLPLDKEFALFSRSGRPYENVKLLSHFKALGTVFNYALDGELYIPGMKFQELSSILRTEDGEIPKELKFHVFDCVPIDEWKTQSCELSYEERLKLMRQTLNAISDYKRVIDVPVDIARSPKEVVNFYKKYIDKGFEGVILRNLDGKYKWKRTTIKSGEILKLKPEETIDLPITGYYDGEGEFKGLIGGVIIDVKGVQVRVGSGFPFEVREELSYNKDKFLGKIIEVKYMEKTEDGSLRHPRFKRFREDKDVVYQS